MEAAKYPVSGVGLGLRRPHLDDLLDAIPSAVDFFEFAPENWMGAGGRLELALEQLATARPVVCHGLTLNIGGPDPLDVAFLAKLKTFLRRHRAACYGDHVSFCASQGHLYELLPMPFTSAAVHHMAARIRQVQDVLEQQITIENASYYITLDQELSEIEFLTAVLEESDCKLLLDVNNIYVNSQNHGYDAAEFLSALPGDRIAYAHIAGHVRDPNGLIVDTHGEGVIDPVWGLLGTAYARFGLFPTLLERDENIPPLATVMIEIERIHAVRGEYSQATERAVKVAESY